MIKSKTKAFTLAEVLVTLMIIGVISALTIPTLKETADRSANLAALQKAYSTASNAFAALKAEYGATMYWTIPNDAKGLSNNSLIGTRVFADNQEEAFSWMLRSKLNVAKTRNITPSGYQIKTLSGTKFDGKINDINVALTPQSPVIMFQSADNMFWFPSQTNAGCQKRATAADGSTIYICAYIVVDTNGAKEPNRMGVDVFVFDVTSDGVIPHVGSDDCKDMSGNGYTCSAKLINGDEHALDFIYE